jgi:hypothetical protein
MVKYRRFLILLAIYLLLWVISNFPYFLEQHYSTGVYPYYARFQRFLLGWVPFSVGDVLYILAAAWLVYGLIVLIRRLIKREWRWRQWLGWGRRFLEGVLVISIVFSLSWGLNYNRLGIAYQLRLQPGLYSTDTLAQLVDSLLIRVNESRRMLPDTPVRLSSGQLARGAYAGYQRMEADSLFPFIRYNGLSVKSSLFGTLDNYMGFLGYYNPFTGEAQVDQAVPAFTLPYTTCHEMAHQLGYASESEANFVGYLAAVHCPDPRYRYSAYFDLFSYAIRELYIRDSVSARHYARGLDTLVKLDFKEYRKFSIAYRNPLEPILGKMYDSYLKAQRQPKGIMSYNEVTGWLIAYERKYGRL